MSEASVSEKILSEDYADLILPVTLSGSYFLNAYEQMGGELLGNNYGMIHIPLSMLPRDLLAYVSYYNIPKLYTLLDESSLEVSGILRVRSQPLLGYTGKDIILGFLDTGINYTLPVFRRSDGRTRIVGIWDQTDQSGTPPEKLSYGSSYTEDDINLALRAEDPFSIVSSVDENGHGTLLASIAAGSENVIPDFSGAAPDADIAMVKLKPAKKFLRDFQLIREDAIAFQETDLMAGVQYFLGLANRLKKPLILCIGLGTNQGSHTGSSPLTNVLSFSESIDGFYSIIAAGNEAGKSHHYAGRLAAPDSVQAVEILVDKEERGFAVELWASSPELYAISMTSPLGETIPTIPARLFQNITLNFTLEKTRVDISYEIVEAASGDQLILIRFTDPTPGIWTLRVENHFYVNGDFQLWLPVTGFISPQTVFLAPDPDTTITDPSTTLLPLAVSTYDAENGSLYLHSSRGYTRSKEIKPDLAAPGVRVSAVNKNGNLTAVTGSSAAAAITAGAAALLINWRINGKPRHLMTSSELKNFLIRGAGRSRDLTYPNRSWGYGTLNVYGVFESLL